MFLLGSIWAIFLLTSITNPLIFAGYINWAFWWYRSEQDETNSKFIFFWVLSILLPIINFILYSKNFAGSLAIWWLGLTFVLSALGLIMELKLTKKDGITNGST